MSSDSKNQPILTLGWKPLASFWNFPMALCVRPFDLFRLFKHEGTSTMEQALGGRGDTEMGDRWSPGY